MSLLKVDNIQKNFGKTEVLKDISFSLEKGEVLAIIGSSGSGKTTLLRCLNFLETPSTGKITVNDNVLFDSDNPSKNTDSETEQTETLPCDYKSQPMSFGLSITNVMPVLSSFNCKDVIIQSTGSIRHAFVITPDNQTETETVTALFMPCHVGED